MALLHADNFNIYGTNAALMQDGVYAQVDSANDWVAIVSDPDGISAAKVLKFNPGNQTGLLGTRYALQNGPILSVGVGLRVWFDILPNSSNSQSFPIALSDSSNLPILSLKVLSNGQISLLGFSNQVLASTGIPVITPHGWYHIEALMTTSGGTGNVEIRVEGVTVMNVTGVVYGNLNNIAQVKISNGNINISGGAPAFYVKDYVIWDTAGSLNTDFLGPVLVTNITTTADVDLNWTPSTGTTGWQILDNVPPDDAQYISAASPAPDPYVGELGNVSTDLNVIKGVITYVRAEKSDGGDGTLQVGMVSGAETVLGADRPITVVQTYWRDVFEVNPDGDVPWTPTSLNAAQIQIDRTT